MKQYVGIFLLSVALGAHITLAYNPEANEGNHAQNEGTQSKDAILSGLKGLQDIIQLASDDHKSLYNFFFRVHFISLRESTFCTNRLDLKGKAEYIYGSLGTKDIYRCESGKYCDVYQYKLKSALIKASEVEVALHEKLKNLSKTNANAADIAISILLFWGNTKTNYQSKVFVKELSKTVETYLTNGGQDFRADFPKIAEYVDNT